MVLYGLEYCPHLTQFYETVFTWSVCPFLPISHALSWRRVSIVKPGIQFSQNSVIREFYTAAGFQNAMKVFCMYVGRGEKKMISCVSVILRKRNLKSAQMAETMSHCTDFFRHISGWYVGKLKGAISVQPYSRLYWSNNVYTRNTFYTDCKCRHWQCTDAIRRTQDKQSILVYTQS